MEATVEDESCEERNIAGGVEERHVPEIEGNLGEQRVPMSLALMVTKLDRGIL